VNTSLRLIRVLSFQIVNYVKHVYILLLFVILANTSFCMTRRICTRYLSTLCSTDRSDFQND